ncbi:MAG: hypothetical protein ACLFV3_06970 [Phycisphaeraceae bacterium]
MGQLRAALQQFQRDWPYLERGETPPPIRPEGGVTLREVADRFLALRRQHVEDGEIKLRTWHEYRRVAQFVVDFFAKTARLNP